MSVRSGSSGSVRYRERELPNSFAVNALIYFCGRNPRRAKSVRAYYYDYEDDARSASSGSSAFSWSSGKRSDVQLYLVESASPYWDGYSDSASRSSPKKRKSRRGSASRASHRSQPTGTWARRNATVEDDSDDDDDSSSSASGSDGSLEDYGHQQGAYPPPPPPPPGMMPPPPPPHGPPPGGAFQPVYGMYLPHATPHPTPPHGFGAPPPPPATAPPPPGGHFVPGPGGIQVFVDG
ncbi:hypothetical protein VTK56DRAFT_4519 [Thermocarpiscus australiensis]